MVSHHLRKREGWKNAQPVKFTVMREFEDELINHAVDANRPADELQVCIGRVIEDEIVAVEDA